MGITTVETSQMRGTAEGFIKNVSRKWTSTGPLAAWPVGKLPPSVVELEGHTVKCDSGEETGRDLYTEWLLFPFLKKAGV